jgi:deazaflavin-dependent oxidoreductase (nitroreductase family)
MSTTTSEQQAIRDPAIRAFPLPGTHLYRLICDSAFKQSFQTRLKRGNRVLVSLYKLRILPLLGLDKRIMLLTTRGRTSHKLRDTPIGYFCIDGRIYVFSSWGKAAKWYQNIRAHPDDVYVQIGFRRFHTRPEVVEDPQDVQRIIKRLVLQDPRGARSLMGWDAKRDQLAAADFSLMIEKVLVIKFHPR